MNEPIKPIQHVTWDKRELAEKHLKPIHDLFVEMCRKLEIPFFITYQTRNYHSTPEQCGGAPSDEFISSGEGAADKWKGKSCLQRFRAYCQIAQAHIAPDPQELWEALPPEEREQIDAASKAMAKSMVESMLGCTLEELAEKEARRVELGNILVTAGVKALIESGDILLDPYIDRHRNGDWGDCCAEDASINEAALAAKDGSRIMSSYKRNGHEALWIITEGLGANRITTVLLPSEY